MSHFSKTWEQLYFIKEVKDRKCKCMICNKVFKGLILSNIKRHFKIIHNDYYILSVSEKQELFKKKESEFNDKRDEECGPDEETSRELIKGASYLLAYNIARHKRPMSDGDFLKKTSYEILNHLEENVAADKIDLIPSSRNTIKNRIVDISSFVKAKQDLDIRNCLAFSICLDESTDISDTSQLIIYYRAVDSSFNVHEDFYSLESLHGTCRGVDIYDALNKSLNGDFQKLFSITTDGAMAMQGKNQGLKGQLVKHGKTNIQMFHCIVHQEALCAKTPVLADTMKIVTSTVNKIRGGHNALTHRKFKEFLKEFNSEYPDLQLHTEIRWLSRGKCLQLFFALRTEILIFIDELKIPYADSLNTKEFWEKVAFLADIMGYLNQLNLQLQGKTKDVFELLNKIDEFVSKIRLLKSNIIRTEFHFFTNMQELMNEDSYKITDTNIFITYLDDLNAEFKKRFLDFDIVRRNISLFYNPMNWSILEQEQSLQFELCALQSDFRLKCHFKNDIDFWRSIDIIKYPLLSTYIAQIYSIFGTSYSCECSFSEMKIIKNKLTNSLSDKMLECYLRLSVNQEKLDIKNLLEFVENEKSNENE